MFLKSMLSFSLLFILMLTLLAYLQLDFQIKKTRNLLQKEIKQII